MTNTAAPVSLIPLGSQTIWAHAEFIRRAADPSTAPIEDVSIHHRGAYILISQKLLHRPNIIAILQKVGGEDMSERVHGIRILVGAGLALPNQPLTPRRAQQAAPLRFRCHNDRQSSYPHHSLKSLFKIASVTPFLRNDTSLLRRLTTAAILPDLQGPVKVRWNPPVPTTIDQHKPIMAAAN